MIVAVGVRRRVLISYEIWVHNELHQFAVRLEDGELTGTCLLDELPEFKREVPGASTRCVDIRRILRQPLENR